MIIDDSGMYATIEEEVIPLHPGREYFEEVHREYRAGYRDMAELGVGFSKPKHIDPSLRSAYLIGMEEGKPEWKKRQMKYLLIGKEPWK
jgi:hypothetical protein